MALNRIRARLERVGPWGPIVVIVALALFIAWAFAATTLHLAGGPMGLPLDDSYIYLTYAKQFGRAQPFSYFPGGGYSAGSTSVLWPMLLAPFWTLGARGHALVWVSFGMCAALYAAVGVGMYRFVRIVTGERAYAGGVASAAMALAIAPFAFCALSGMEVAFAAALLVGSLLLLARAPREGRPSWLLVACLSATSLSRPEAMLLVGGIVGVSVLVRVYRRAWREAAWWCLPLVAPVAWLVANRVIAGNFFPNTGVAKSHFYLPGFDWTYWIDAVKTLSKALLVGLFSDAKSPLVWPRIVLVLYLAGCVRVALWARRERRYLVGALVVLAPFVMMLAVIASSGLWSFQNYRYIAPSFPLLLIPVGIALTPLGENVWMRRTWAVAALVVAALFANAGRPQLVADMRLFAQGAMDTNTQVVRIGQYLHDKLPDARVMFHDAGAIAYYGDGEVYDMLGLVTNHQAGIANNGPGARFEFLESLPPDQRPTHFAYYPGWMGTFEFFGQPLLHTSLRRGLDSRRLVGEGDMQVLPANWDHVHTAERPINDQTGWNLVDRVDIADLASERAHGWRGAMGRRHVGDPTARWSIVEKSLQGGLYIDGGRTIREGTEQFTVHVDPLRPARVVIRTGGQRTYAFHESIGSPVELSLYSGTKKLGTLTLAPPAGPFAEVQFSVPPQTSQDGTLTLRTQASGPYRVFHWFILQPE